MTAKPLRADFRGVNTLEGWATQIAALPEINRHRPIIVLRIEDQGQIRLRRSAAIDLALQIADAVEWIEKSQAVHRVD